MSSTVSIHDMGPKQEMNTRSNNRSHIFSIFLPFQSQFSSKHIFFSPLWTISSRDQCNIFGSVTEGRDRATLQSLRLPKSDQIIPLLGIFETAPGEYINQSQVIFADSWQSIGTAWTPSFVQFFAFFYLGLHVHVSITSSLLKWWLKVKHVIHATSQIFHK